jgi:vacuolar-type H+-ATPase subunit I/STV1
MRDKDRTGFDIVYAMTRGFTAIDIFLFFGATMACLAAISLLWRGTALDGVWALNPTAYKELAPLGGSVGILFLLLGATLTVAGVGWFRHRLSGWRLAIAIIATQVLGDVVNYVRGDLLRGGIGVIIAGGLLLSLLRSKIRAAFV